MKIKYTKRITKANKLKRDKYELKSLLDFYKEIKEEMKKDNFRYKSS